MILWIEEYTLGSSFWGLNILIIYTPMMDQVGKVVAFLKKTWKMESMNKN